MAKIISTVMMAILVMTMFNLSMVESRCSFRTFRLEANAGNQPKTEEPGPYPTSPVEDITEEISESILEEEDDDDDDDDGDDEDGDDDFEEYPPQDFVYDGDESAIVDIGAKHFRRNMIRPWPNARIPFAIWGSLQTRRKVLAALAKIEAKTCLRFTERQSEGRYVLIKEDDGGCWTSSLGYPSSNKRVIIGLGAGCRVSRAITHEVLHAAGFVHEHNRPDRNQYVKVQWDNVKRKGRSNYRLDVRYPTLSIPYDYKSVMHYGRKTFAVNRSKPTLTSTTPIKGNFGGSKLSPLDVQRINAFYEC